MKQTKCFSLLWFRNEEIVVGNDWLSRTVDANTAGDDAVRVLIHENYIVKSIIVEILSSLEKSLEPYMMTLLKLLILI